MRSGDDNDAAGTDRGAGALFQDQRGIFQVLDDVPDSHRGIEGRRAEFTHMKVAEDFVMGSFVVFQLLRRNVDDGDLGTGGDVDMAEPAAARLQDGASGEQEGIDNRSSTARRRRSRK